MGDGVFTFTFSPSATCVAFSGELTSGSRNSRTARWMLSDDAVRSLSPSIPSIRAWNVWPGGSEYASAAYRSTVFALTSLPPPWPTSTLEVITLITCGSFVSETECSIWSLNERTNSCWRAVR